MVPSTASGREGGKAHHSLGPTLPPLTIHARISTTILHLTQLASSSRSPAPPSLWSTISLQCPALAPHREAMALRSAAVQAATLLRLRGGPAVTQHLWAPLTRRSISTTQFASDEVREGLHYADSHEWVKVDGDIGTVGITDHAQRALGDLVFVELPEAGTSLTGAEKLGSVESVKAVSDIISPVSGEVIETNSTLTDAPETINSSPYDDGWLVKVKLSGSPDLKKLMNHEQYDEFQNAH